MLLLNTNRGSVSRKFLSLEMDLSSLITMVTIIFSMLKITRGLKIFWETGSRSNTSLEVFHWHCLIKSNRAKNEDLHVATYIHGDGNSYKTSILQQSSSPDCVPLPSIVVCPPTLTGHWVYETEKFVSTEHLRVLHYTGTPAERHRWGQGYCENRPVDN